MTVKSANKVFGGVLLVAGTCIGAGMLALPVSTGPAGFFPSLFAFIFCWIVMTLSALLMVEVSLRYPRDTNLITMAKSTLGKPGAIIAFLTYVLFFYALMAAYTIAASNIVEKFLNLNQMDETWALWIVAGIFAFIVYLGTHAVDIANRILMIGLVLGYFVMVGLVLPEINIDLLHDGHPKYLLAVGSLLVTSFGFHLLIPSLKDYVDGDPVALKWSVILGSLIPLVVYLFWEIVVLGVVPIKGESGLLSILYAEQMSGKQAVVELTGVLSNILDNEKVRLSADIFCLCAILTSFIGVALALFDFFSDSFHIHKDAKGKVILSLLTFLVPVLIAVFYPSFLVALHYAGFFAAILLVIYPAIMCWSGRYFLKTASPYQLMGGKPMVAFIFLFGIAIIVLEIMDRSKMLPNAIVEGFNVF